MVIFYTMNLYWHSRQFAHSASYRYLSKRQNTQYVIVSECKMSASLIINHQILGVLGQVAWPVFLINFLQP